MHEVTVTLQAVALGIIVANVWVAGREAALMTCPSSEDEWRKRLTSVLLEGATVVTLDNVKEPLQSASLAAAITATTWKDRVLGESRTVELPVRCTWTATGNNMAVRGDLPRRCYWIRLNAQQPRPWQRAVDSFRRRLPACAHHARGRLLAALLTLCRAWIVGGRPDPVPYVTMGSFESWQETVGGILANAEVGGFLENFDRLYERADSESDEWQ